MFSYVFGIIVIMLGRGDKDVVGVIIFVCNSELWCVDILMCFFGN